MSKKTDELAVSAITGVDVSQDEKGVTSGKTSVFLGSFPFGSPYFARCAVGNLNSDFSSENISASSSMIDYPANQTDQIHALSVSEMVRNGQGDVRETTLENFDFQAGERDDGSVTPVSMQQLDWADPAEIYEAHHNLDAEIKNSILLSCFLHYYLSVYLLNQKIYFAQKAYLYQQQQK